jgi:hypothetical protein
MKRSISERRREFLAFLSALPISLLSHRSSAQPKQLKLGCYYLPETFQAKGAQLFADKIAQVSAGAIQVSVEAPKVPIFLDLVAKESALVVYFAPCVPKSEPLLNLSTLPMLAATFDEAATLHRIARPYYSAALARHGQMLLAIQLWLPGALSSTFQFARLPTSTVSHSQWSHHQAPPPTPSRDGDDLLPGWAHGPSPFSTRK